VERRQYKIYAEFSKGFFSGKNPAVILTIPKALAANK